jgi:hypothetical protein
VASDAFSDRRPAWPDLDPCGAAPVMLGLEEVVGKAHFAPSSVVVRRSCLDAVGLFDPALRCVEDRDMWIRLASRFALAKLPLPLLYFRLHANSLSTRASHMEEAEWRVLDRAFAQIPALRGRRLLRRRVYSLSAFASAQVFAGAGRYGAALRRVLRSFLLWPPPFRSSETDVCWARLRVLAVLLLRMLRLRAPDPAVGSPPPPPRPVEMSAEANVGCAQAELTAAQAFSDRSAPAC